MRIRTTRLGIILLACFTLFTVLPGFVPSAHAQTYFYRSLEQQSGIPQSGPPMPLDIYDGAEPIITLDATRQIFEVEDTTNAYALLVEAMQLDAMSAKSGGTMSADSIDPTGGSGDTNSAGGDYTNSFQPLVFGPDDLVIQITNVDIVNQQASLQLTNTVPYDLYQLLYTNTLGTSNSQSWTLGEIITGAYGTNITPFSTFNIGTNSQMFFRAHHSGTEIGIAPVQDAFEPNGPPGEPGRDGTIEIFSETSLTNDLTVQYTVSGTAQPGVDYDNSSLTGAAVIPAAIGYTNINITPLQDPALDGTETLTLSLQQTNSYLIDPNSSSATILIQDSSTTVYVYLNSDPDAFETNGPPTEPAQAAEFRFTRDDSRGLYPPMTAYFIIGGTASNGVDYAYLSNTVDFADGVSDAYVDVNPLPQSIFDGTETVTVTLVPTNSYFVDTNNGYSASANILDSSTTVNIYRVQDAIETNSTTGDGQQGIFEVDRDDTRGYYPPMTVLYTIGGTATNGVDYQTLTGTVAFDDGAQSAFIYVNTIEEDLIEPDETVTLTLIPNGNAYYINSGQSNATLTIHTTVGFFNVATNFNGLVGIDYYSLSNSLIVSYNENASGTPFLFAQVYTNIVNTNGAIRACLKKHGTNKIM